MLMKKDDIYLIEDISYKDNSLKLTIISLSVILKIKLVVVKQIDNQLIMFILYDHDFISKHFSILLFVIFL